MSKNSRARARARKQSVMPKMLAVVGVIAVVAAAVAGAHSPSRAARATSAPENSAAQPVAPASSPAPGAATGAASLASNATTPGKKLLFFMNPNGYPCQTQLGILNGVADTLSKVAQVVLIKTTEEADMQKFEAYGIRSLPTLVIADQNGRELSRFSPGVQSSDAVLAALTR